MKEQREEDYAAGDRRLEQDAGQAARRILHERGLEDTAANWKAIKEAYLLGFNEGLLK